MLRAWGNGLGAALVILTLTACASDAPERSHVSFAARERIATTRSAARAEAARLRAERVALLRTEAERVLATLPEAPDAAARRAILVRVRDLAPEVLGDLHPTALAALAPDVLRVYDVGAALDDGGDDEGLVPEPLRDAPNAPLPRDGASAYLARLVEGLRADLSTQPNTELAARDAFVDATAAGVVAVLPAESFAALERALDRRATTGGGAVRVHVALGAREDGPASPDVTWTTASFAAARAELAARGAVEELALDVPHGRRRSALRGVQHSYVSDFDVAVDVDVAIGDPQVDTLLDGLGVSAAYGPDGAGDAAVALTFGECAVAQPIPTFTTSPFAGAEPVRIQIPELRAARFRTTRGADEGGSGTARLPDGRALVVSVERLGGGAPRPAWSRVAPGATPAARFEHPLLENALALAAATHAAGDPGGADALRQALRAAPQPVWGQRVRPSGDTAEGVLYRVPLHVDAARARAELARAGLGGAPGYGFVDVEGGMFTACVGADDAAAAVRCLLRLASGTARPDDATLTCTTPQPPRTTYCGDDADARADPLRAAWLHTLSFVQDFDVETAAGACVADPIVGVLAEGTTARAQPCRSDPDAFDVAFTTAVVERPLPQFETSLGAGAPVTLQLPRVRIETTWRRVACAAGAEVTVAASDAADAPRFVLRRAPSDAAGR